ncbi:LysR family transcriptional regulator [Pseudoduganella ginsengisoli]|uniref:LysR family transcriptional regulator n=1 Tax=Pseudoduganella ginsengisoli TaxID=1462440 RepID=A0A6L6Q963_9BURK|nr:LysR family transcriptional regulator [Pseudoduganella ginsengisoli]MTW06019.1 LysR family transcriptional regulator [Pseudoduganella ginsengisoli]
MLRFDDLSVFVRTADEGSLSAAARTLEMSPALASAALKRLEGTLGLRLVVRTTRSLRLTDEGEQYLLHAREALRQLKEGHDKLVQRKETPGGLLRIAMPSDLGRNTLLYWLDKFQAQYPNVQYQLSVSDRQADMFRQPVDLALRYGRQDDSTMVAMPIAPDNRRALAASPEYVRKHGKPASLADLVRHNCLCYVLEDVVHNRWTFYPPDGSGDGKPVTLLVQGNRCADDADLVRRWAVAGQGIVYKSRMDLADDLRHGRLQILLPEWLGEPTPLHLVCMHRAQVTPTVLLLRDFLREQYQQL